MTKPRRYVNSSLDMPLTFEEEKAILDDPDFWKGWKEHIEAEEAKDRAKKLNIPVIWPEKP